jgi:hypothetical protein
MEADFVLLAHVFLGHDAWGAAVRHERSVCRFDLAIHGTIIDQDFSVYVCYDVEFSPSSAAYPDALALLMIC